MLFPTCFQVGLGPLQAVRCNLLCLKPGLFFSTPSLSPHHFSKSYFFIVPLSGANVLRPRLCLSIVKRTAGVGVTWTCVHGRRSMRGLTVIQGVLFSWCPRLSPANDTIYEARGSFCLFTGGGIYISSLTQGCGGRPHVPALHVQLHPGNNCCINLKGVVKK